MLIKGKSILGEKFLPGILSIAILIAFLPLQVHAASEVIRRGPADKLQVALTFDDGYDPVNTDKVLDVLAAHGIAATFFLNGKAIENNRNQARRVVKEGHELANHSYSHQRLTEISSNEVFKEISLTEKAAKEVTGKDISRIFRVPFGAFNQEVLNLLKEAGYPYTIQWTIDPRDWEGPSASAIHQQVIREMKPGAIVVLHVSKDAANTAAALPMIINDLTARGYQFVTVSEMIFGTGNDTSPKPNPEPAPSPKPSPEPAPSPKPNPEPAPSPKPNPEPEAAPNSPDHAGSGTKSTSEPKPAPKPASRPLPTAPAADQGYAVQAGDSLQRIAKEFGILLKDLLIVNRIQKPAYVFVGQPITIPGESPKAKQEMEEGQWLHPDDYCNAWLKADDALHRLASDYRVTVEQLLDENGDLNLNIHLDEPQIQLR